MGLRLSKSATTNSKENNKRNSLPVKRINSIQQDPNNLEFKTTLRHSLPIPTLVGSQQINLRIEESPTNLSSETKFINHSLNSLNTNTSGGIVGGAGSSIGSFAARQIIIKIQLAKMDNGNETPHQSTTAIVHAGAGNCVGDSSPTESLNSSNRISMIQQQIPEADLQRLSMNGNNNRTAGSSSTTSMSSQMNYTSLNNNNNNNNLQQLQQNDQQILTSLNSLQASRNPNRTNGSSANNGYPSPFLPSDVASNSSLSSAAKASPALLHLLNLEASAATSSDNTNANEDNKDDLEEYCEVLESVESSTQQPTSNVISSDSSKVQHNTQNENSIKSSNDSKCCNHKSRNSSSSTNPASRRRCCKCTCINAVRRIMEPKYSKNNNKNDVNNQKQKISSHSNEAAAVQVPQSELPAQQQAPSLQPLVAPAQIQQNWPHVSTTTQYPIIPAEAIASLAHLPIVPSPTTVATVATNSGNVNSQVSIWAPNNSQQFLLVSCMPSSVLTVGRTDDNSFCVLAASEEIRTNDTNLRPLTSSQQSNDSNNQNQNKKNNNTGKLGSINGLTVHSQVDYMHCLVPDLDRITNSSFYWGKMDRYEAERLLEGKDEGTFLLRDSAQEEFLFSVTFRKFGRSLHARIEQSGHKFSFDCHDPCVFTASTVTGLLEHYKDPTCVMFFEPMLTIPLHRKKTFSLQQLCRAKIVSNTTYDGINEMELPLRLKSYLKEYHYKQKLRIKPLDDHLYSCT